MSRTAPSHRSSPSCTSTAKSTTAPVDSGASRRRIDESTVMTHSSAEIPRTRVRFATFEPMMLPTAMSSFPCVEAIPDTTISGALVPNPTTTAPMMTGGTLSAADRRAAPVTN